jgi:DNA-binding SARP family transcriptional activator/tetratricopeptide (TPR) repeat protein
VEFLVLGPLEVRSARESLPLGGPRLRAVLADLVLHAGSVVPMDTLIDDLWGAESPPTAEAVVQNAVMKLRKTLGRDVIETRPPGYMLAVDPGAIDSRRFERLVRDARPLPPAERSAALRDALALWRGSAFSDLSFESFLQEEIARLDELRLAALEERLEAELELGRHDAVVPEASVLADQHPARERLSRILMLALYRAGRQQEALDAYGALHRALDELFGIEPSPETRALHLMILKQDPAIAVTPEPPRSGGVVRRPVALLVVELLLDEELELEAAGSALEDARRALAEVAARHGGFISSESGVELVASFGAEAAYEDDVLRAARAAVELNEMLSGREVDARLAVGTGRLLVEDARPVLVGGVVTRTRRVLHDAGAGEILVTPTAARVGGDALDLDADGRLLGVRPGRPRPTATPLVGRADELASLRSAFDHAVETGRPHHAIVVGEAGIGKSRLVAEFVQDVSAAVLETACVPYGEGISFLPLRELAERAGDLDPGAPELGELTDADAALAAARKLFEHFTASEPLVVVVDDAHWAVPTFLDLVEYVLRAVAGPLLVVSTTRPELLDQRSSWAEHVTRLEPLGGADARSLVDALPERLALDETVATSILETAEGVPFFLEQLAAHAAESDLAGDRIPATVDALLASRIDALHPGERDVLLRAAVAGRSFSRESVGALTPDEELQELDGRIASLGRRRLLRSKVGEHEFAHPLVRRAAYEAIGRAERAQLHARFARWLDARDEADELVGTHLERAALDITSGPERVALARDASARLGAAGRRALLAPRHAEDNASAANLLERASSLLRPEDVDRLELECHLGHALKGLGDFGQATDVLQRVVERATAAGHRHLDLRARIELIYPLMGTGAITTEDAVDLLDEAVRAFEDYGDTLGVARAELTYSHVMSWREKSDLALVHIERAERAYEQLGVAGATGVAAVWAALRGTTRVEDGLRRCEENIGLYPDQVRSQPYVHAYLGYLRALGGDIEGSREAGTIAREQLEAAGEQVGLRTSAALPLGSAEALLADWPRAEETWEVGLAYVRDRPEQRSWYAYFLARLGEVALAVGDAERAADLAEQCRTTKVDGDMETELWWRRVAARSLSVMGHPRRAARLAREVVSLADRTDSLLFRGEARLDLAEVLLLAGRSAQAALAVHEGLELLERKGAALAVANGRARFAELLDPAAEGAASAAPLRQSS